MQFTIQVISMFKFSYKFNLNRYVSELIAFIFKFIYLSAKKSNLLHIPRSLKGFIQESQAKINVTKPTIFS